MKLPTLAAGILLMTSVAAFRHSFGDENDKNRQLFAKPHETPDEDGRNLQWQSHYNSGSGSFVPPAASSGSGSFVTGMYTVVNMR